MYKLLALDLDGTVLTSHHTILPALKAKIQALKNDVEVVIATGRHHTAARPYHDELELTTPIICCNGTYLYDYAKNDVLSQNSIQKDIAIEFIELAGQHNMNIVMYVTDSMLYSKTKPVNYMLDMDKWADGFNSDNKPSIKSIDNFIDEVQSTKYVWKFVIEGDNTDDFAQLPFVKEHFSAERSWHNRVDFANKGNQKGVALSHYAKSLGLSPDQIVAAGDNHNDITMLEFAGMGVAMAQADKRVKNSAKKVTLGTNDEEHGLAAVLDELFRR